jgi:hypothetical protein
MATPKQRRSLMANPQPKMMTDINMPDIKSRAAQQKTLPPVLNANFNTLQKYAENNALP